MLPVLVNSWRLGVSRAEKRIAAAPWAPASGIPFSTHSRPEYYREAPGGGGGGGPGGGAGTLAGGLTVRRGRSASRECSERSRTASSISLPHVSARSSPRARLSVTLRPA